MAVGKHLQKSSNINYWLTFCTMAELRLFTGSPSLPSKLVSCPVLFAEATPAEMKALGLYS